MHSKITDLSYNVEKIFFILNNTKKSFFLKINSVFLFSLFILILLYLSGVTSVQFLAIGTVIISFIVVFFSICIIVREAEKDQNSFLKDLNNKERFSTEEKIIKYIEKFKEESNEDFIKERHKTILIILSDFKKREELIRKKVFKNIENSVMDRSLSGGYKKVNDKESYYQRKVSLLNDLDYLIRFRLRVLDSKENTLESKKELTIESLELAERNLSRIKMNEKMAIEEINKLKLDLKNLNVNQFYEENEMFTITEKEYMEND